MLPLVRELVTRAPNRLLWGSDCDSDLLDMMLDWIPDEKIRNRIFVDNPIEVFGFRSVDN